MQNGAFLQKI